MQLVRYNPFRELLDMDKEINKLLGSGWDWTPSLADISTIDMYMEEDKLFIEASLPHFKKEDINVEVADGSLEIKAQHEEHEEKKEKGRQYILKESSRNYTRRLNLPEGAVTDEIRCAFKNGKLRITMPVKEQPKAKTISIE